MIAILNGHSLAVKNYFRAEKFALNLSERQSTATLTVGSEAPEIKVGDWLRDEEDPGKGIVWRVKTVDTAYETNTRTIQLEHMIQSLRDRIMFGEIPPGTMAGNAKAKTCTALQAVTYILKQQSDWTVGAVGYTKSAPYNFNSDDLYSALETVSSSLLDAWWSYDFSAYPFKLNIKPKSTAAACEMRTDRNIRTLKKSIDRSRMYTRFYPIGKNNLKLSGGGYVEKNTNLYGVVSKLETDNEKDTEEKLRAWANEKLNNHAEPIVTVTVSGLDLSKATGEALDKLTLGTVCRIPLPEFSTTITERIEKLSWSDKNADPESVTITLANQTEDVASIINNIQKKAGGGGKSAAKQAEEDHAWFVDTTDHVAMVAEAVAGEGASQDWSRVASVLVDGEGIHQRVTETEKDLVTAQSGIDLSASQINQFVKAVGKDGKITAASICLAVNNAGSSVTINADKIRLLGQTIADTITADYITTKIAHIPRLNAMEFHASTIYAGTNMYLPNGLSVNLGLMTVTLSGPDNNVYTLKQQTLGGTETTIGTFSRATSLSGEWSSNKWTVTASPQGNTIAVLPQVHAVSSQGGAYTDVYVGTHDGSNWTNHGSATRLTLSTDGLTVNLKDPNGSIMATISAENPYPSSASMTQHTNATGTKNFTAYYLAPDGTTYVSMGQHYWYHSGSNIGSRTVHY